MIRFIRELRRREVFRTLGFYVGVCWILIEASSFVLPAFEAPEWVLRGLITVAVVGFPIVGVLAWIYDLSAKGIAVQGEPTDTVVPGLGARKMDFVVIGVLAVALAFSVFLNVTGGPELVEELEPVSVLIADFENSTSETIFDGLLEQALNIGIENAPHVTSLGRREAEDLAGQLRTVTNGLPSDLARLVAVREGVDIVLAGSIETGGSGFHLEVSALNPISGESLFDVSADAISRDSVLTAIDVLSEGVRLELGDEIPMRGEEATAETFTAASIEAASAYMKAIELAYEGRHQEAIEEFTAATESDSNFGRAFAAWALSEFRLGRQEEAARLWDRALSLMGTMTERERLRTLGVYYTSVTRNHEKAVETFSELVEKYPADAAGRNNLAVSAFRTLDFETATTEGRRILEIYPNSQLYRANFALYAMYSGDFDVATIEARRILEDDPDYGTAYLPLAISLVATGDYNGAREAYARMAAASATEHRESLATLGSADVSIYVGDFAEAEDLLQAGIDQDIAQDARLAAAVKHVALGETYVQSGEYSMAIDAVGNALDLSPLDSIKIAAALVFLESGELESAASIAEELSVQLNTHSRVYGMMIEAAILRQSGAYVEAIDTLRTAVDIADLWRIRYELGRAYLDAGFFVEAFDQFEICVERRGEATAMFLDDMPTFRHLGVLAYWLGRAQEGLGMQGAAAENYRAFLALRPEGGSLAEDTRRRLQ